MKTIKFFILLCVAIVSGNLSAQSQRELSQLMRNRGEYYFTITVDDPSEIQSISNICSVDGTDGRTVVAYANQQEYEKLLQAGYQLNLQTPPSLREEAVMWEGGDRATYDWNSYLTYGDYVSMMEGFPSSVTNGAHCTFLDLGTLSTTNHRRILGVRLNNGQTNGKPKFLYTSTMHGDEVTGMILMLRLINEFCTSNDTRIQNILNNVDLFIFPCTNPDGTYNGGNNTVTGAKRYNGNNVDLNRHFPDFDDGAHPDGASYYQDECQWMMDLAQEHLFTMGANYHGGAEVMNYPWDTYQPVHPDDAWWQYVSLEYVRLARQVYSSYMSDTESNGITNGYAWYTITGSRQDYMNYYGQCREITIECSSTKTPSASQLPNFWNYNHNSMLAYIEQCLNGIHGVVKDTNTNEPIEGATITVKNHDALGSSVTSHAVGDFHRPIKGGTWTLEVSKSGYHTETVNVTVADDQHVDLTVYLTPRGADEMDCYEQVQPSAADNYVMGYLNGTTLKSPSHNSSSTVTTNSLDVTPTDNGFSVAAETTIPQVTLTAYSNGRYYISYNGRYLSRSGSNLTWSTSQPSNGRWYINSDGIYVTSTGWSSTTYYLYYNGSNFALSTSQQNNIHFYVPGECPIPEFNITASANPTEGGTVTGTGTYNQGTNCTLTATTNEGYTFINWTENGEEVSTEMNYSFNVMANRTLVANFEEVATTVSQTLELSAGWNWWTPNVELQGSEVLSLLEQGIGSKGIKIAAQDGKVRTYSTTYGIWTGSLNAVEVGKMYKIQINGDCSFEISGPAIVVENHSMTLSPGLNWIGFFGAESMSLNTALQNLTPTAGDIIAAEDGTSATYSATYGWNGRLQSLVPGQAYTYRSNASIAKTFFYPTVTDNK